MNKSQQTVENLRDALAALRPNTLPARGYGWSQGGTMTLGPSEIQALAAVVQAAQAVVADREV